MLVCRTYRAAPSLCGTFPGFCSTRFLQHPGLCGTQVSRHLPRFLQHPVSAAPRVVRLPPRFRVVRLPGLCTALAQVRAAPTQVRVRQPRVVQPRPRSQVHAPRHPGSFYTAPDMCPSLRFFSGHPGLAPDPGPPIRRAWGTLGGTGGFSDAAIPIRTKSNPRGVLVRCGDSHAHKEPNPKWRDGRLDAIASMQCLA